MTFRIHLGKAISVKALEQVATNAANDAVLTPQEKMGFAVTITALRLSPAPILSFLIPAFGI